MKVVHDYKNGRHCVQTQ